MSNSSRLKQLISLLDLTRLIDSDEPLSFQTWLNNLPHLTTPVAALCVYPEFVSITAAFIKERQLSTQLATVVNFPSGEQTIAEVVQDISRVIALGVSEIDCVLPYQALMAGKDQYVKDFLAAVRNAAEHHCLKIIIESGELVTAQQVAKASELSITAGADFIKTSTGKVPVGCTLEAAQIMLSTIAAADRPVGFKASGGVKTLPQALAIMDIYERITGLPANSAGLRIGASSLIDEILTTLDDA